MKKYLFYLVTLLIFPAYTFANGSNRAHMDGWDHMMGFGYGGMFMWILFLIVTVLIVYFIVRALKPTSSDISFKETPLDVLKKRYAKGEITKEKFDEMKKVLED